MCIRDSLDQQHRFSAGVGEGLASVGQKRFTGNRPLYQKAVIVDPADPLPIDIEKVLAHHFPAGNPL